MKNFTQRYIGLFALLFTMCLSVNAQEKSVIKFIQEPFEENYLFGYERVINSKMTCQFGFGYSKAFFDTWDGPYGNAIKNRVEVVFLPETRYYFKNSLNGLYTSLGIRLRVADVDFDHLIGTEVTDNPDRYFYEETLSNLGGTLTIGYQELIGSRVLVDLFFGPVYKSILVFGSGRDYHQNYSVQSSGGEDFHDLFPSMPEDEEEPFSIRVGFSVGIGF
tara:strand:- start:277 stop:933 length:657 start_codon:yes stop_codon:yes gene_type:complete